ncbi:MAG TPA: tryptophan--tRNA ligase [Myxococcota bacterium]|nr:tryptophan--tRNA ligase [Myxococcota bacterium]
MRILSGIKPSGEAHFGNYFGAMRQYVELQGQGDAIYFIADYHSMDGIRDAKQRRELVSDLVLDYLASGLDPARAIVYRQSDLPETCELTWLLTSVTPMGLLQRAHAYKDAVAKGELVDHGLFAYPVLMAADILQFATDLVPVGQDQKQHIEMARDIAVKFNQTYGREVFKLPEARILEEVAVVPGVDGRKMSKSYGNVLRMFWPEKQLRKAIMAIVTDSSPVEAPKNTEQALFQLWSLFATKAEREALFARAAAGGLGYGEVKKDLADRALAYFAPLRARREELARQPGLVEDVLAQGVKRARALAAPLFEAAREAAGIGAAR